MPDAVLTGATVPESENNLAEYVVTLLIKKLFDYTSCILHKRLQEVYTQHLYKDTTPTELSYYERPS